MRVDRDVLEILYPMRTERIPVSNLAVRLDRQGKKKFQMYIGRSQEPGPLYAWHWTPAVMGKIWMIDVDDEPDCRAFFTELADFCGRTVTLEPDPRGRDEDGEPKRRRFGRRSS